MTADGAPPELGPGERMPGGKDVTWVPTSDVVIARMLDMAGVAPGDVLIDLGSGDGRTVIAAARRGATAMGVEYDGDKVELSVRNAAEAGVADRASFVQADLFEVDLSRASVLTLFLLPALNLRLRPRILDLRPGTRVATNTFDFADWEADDKFEVPAPECTAYCWALHWVVPAKVAGRWHTPHGELELKQSFQLVWGTFRSGGVHVRVVGNLRGDAVTLLVGGATVRGRVRGDVIEGSGPWAPADAGWSATRS